MALVEYAILIVFAIIGSVFVLGHHHGAHPITSGWASPTGEGGKGSATAGFLIAVFMFIGWDGARFLLRSDFFSITRETGPREETRAED